MKRSIRSKLMFSYAIIVILTLVVTGSLFFALVRSFLIKEAMDSLRQEAKIVLSAYQDSQRVDVTLPNPQKRRFSIRLASHFLDSAYAIVNAPGQEIIDTNVGSLKRGERFPIDLTTVFHGEELDIAGKIADHQIVMVAIPVATKSGKVEQAVVLTTPIQGIQEITRRLVVVLVEGFVLALLVTITVAWFMGRSLTRPVHVLVQAVKRISQRDFTSTPVVQSGDELEILSRSISGMAVSLGQYDEAQRRFLQHASHELKSPLMAIQGYAEGIRDGIFEGEEADKGLDTIVKESGRLKKLVDELIYLSKLETLENIYTPELLRLDDIVQDCIEALGSLATQKDVSLKKRGSSSSLVNVDPNKFMQALVNVVSNGIRHAQSLVELDIYDDGKTVEVRILDDGSGLDESEKGRIFERFYRGDKGDTGLGLAITHAIIEKSGGRITADNRSEGGTSFVISLPRASQDA